MIVEYFVGGASDKDDNFAKLLGGSGIMSAVRLRRKASESEVTTYYNGHEEEDAILEEIKNKIEDEEDLTINLTGHSWGGQAVMNLTNRLEKVDIKVNELITLDPVSFFPFFALNNFNFWVNVYQDQSLLDYLAAIPIIGNLVSGLVSGASSNFVIPSAKHSLNDTIATTGGQLGSQNGATNVNCALDHADALGMYFLARNKMDSLVDQ